MQLGKNCQAGWFNKILTLLIQCTLKSPEEVLLLCLTQHFLNILIKIYINAHSSNELWIFAAIYIVKFTTHFKELNLLFLRLFHFDL